MKKGSGYKGAKRPFNGCFSSCVRAVSSVKAGVWAVLFQLI